MPREFKLATAKEAGMEVFILMPKESDQSCGYVIYQVPPVGQAEIAVGPGWSREETTKMKDAVRQEIGGNVTVSVSRIKVISEEGQMTERETQKDEEALGRVGSMLGELFKKPRSDKTAASRR